MLAVDCQLNGNVFTVDADPTISVSRLKKLIKAEKSPTLDNVVTDSLILLRLFKQGQGGVKLEELEEVMKLNESNSLADAKETEKEVTSMFCEARGSYFEMKGLSFKVMSSEKRLMYYVQSMPDQLCHILVLSTSLQAQMPSTIRARDQFLFDNNLNLERTEDVIKYLQHKIDVLAPWYSHQPYKAHFLNNCLEFRLDRRETMYSLDSHDNIKLLLSVSGSGKTRQLLELLFDQFGYYFVVDRQLIDFGSGDLTRCLIYSVRHPEKAEYFIELLYFVRGYVCNYLFDLGYSSPSQMLLAQLHPKAFFGCDLFSELFDSLARRTDINIGRSSANIKLWFDFVAIDEIQRSLEGEHVFLLPGSQNSRPFFSPLVYYSKHMGKFCKFIVSGTGMNFLYLSELLLSGTMKSHQVTACDVISDLKPLDSPQAREYIRRILGDNNVHANQIEEVVNQVSTNPLFLGRGRFVAFILDSFLEGDTLDLAITKFIDALSQPERSLFPLKFYLSDMKNRRNAFDRIVGGETLGDVIRRGLIEFFMKGEATLHVKDQLASDTVLYGLGFCNVVGGLIQSVELKELAVIECLRYLIPVSELIPDICIQLVSFPKPQMIGCVLEYLVAFAFVSELDPDKARTLKATHGNFASYLHSNDENEVLFPDHCCGPDIVYKHEGTVYMIQLKFVDKISKQERMNACHTTDPNRFYWNKVSGVPLKGFEPIRNVILQELKNTTCRRIVFRHTKTQTTVGMDGIEVVNQRTKPKFFDNIHPSLWDMLNKLRDNLNKT
ncbi:hypothetical protein BCR33DRAFT_816742 [Rhizoclosmatium globosum]|uniref:Crinkler effector protein N-terminal domain-containing protein n=1 Tax=Rhizoclosmatium globosum TaxID=329046 RepID=A0A1Y2CCZ5_9FUNG|nr:hypothetical protein BCR33DRAFT_816742 [Rhizoclosmatium globosum]|eukprot:ORY44920.1 hypothetical protein BCR33DRAFT_816742 [Rhizoclosmatium globosum]